MMETAETSNACDSDQECLGTLKRRLGPGVSIRHDVDTEQVIYEVRSRPVLWDASHALYKNQTARLSAWQEIYEALFLDYQNFNDDKQKRMGKMVQMRWKTARDGYIKYKNSLKIGEVSKKYAFSDIMTFLDKMKNDDEYDSSTNQDPYQTIRPEKRGRKLKKLKILRRRIPADDEHHDCNKDMFALVKLLKNDDIAFFMSLLPVTQKFSMHQKLTFRSEVLKKAMDISTADN